MLPWERRLRDLAHHLQACRSTYFEPEFFRLNLNQFLQTSRTVTFLIQKQKDSIPDFQNWYAKNVVEPLANDTKMVWARDARNEVEKEGDLLLHSSIDLTLIFSHWAEEDLILTGDREELIVANVKRLVRFARRALPTGVSDAAVLKIERKWIANSLPDNELMSVMTYIYSRLYANCAALAKHLKSPLDQEVPEPTFLGIDQSPRIQYVQVANNDTFRLVQEVQDYDETVHGDSRVIAVRNSVPLHKKPTDLRSLMSIHSELAEATFKSFGNHVHMLFLYDDEWSLIHLVSTEFADQADKYIFTRNAAERAALVRARAVLLTSEAWIRSPKEFPLVATRNLPIVGEQLQLLGADIDGEFRSIAWDIVRDAATGNAVLDSRKEESYDESHWPFIDPIIRAMKDVRRIG